MCTRMSLLSLLWELHQFSTTKKILGRWFSRFSTKFLTIFWRFKFWVGDFRDIRQNFWLFFDELNFGSVIFAIFDKIFGYFWRFKFWVGDFRDFQQKFWQFFDDLKTHSYLAIFDVSQKALALGDFLTMSFTFFYRRTSLSNFKLGS
jgi:hypothetical protein